MELMRLENFKISSTSSTIVEIDDMKVTRGKILGIVGRSGSGKTMTFKGATGLILERGLNISGNIYWQGKKKKVSHMRKLLGKNISYVMQNPMTSFNQVHTIGYHCYETLRYNLNLDKKESRELICKWLSRFALLDQDRILTSYPYQLSGGMLQRVMLSIAMALGSDMIIADEPTTALDNVSQKEIIESFIEANRSYGVTIVFISHDFPLISQIAHEIGVIIDGQLVEIGKSKDILTRPENIKTIKMLKGLIDNDKHF